MNKYTLSIPSLRDASGAVALILVMWVMVILIAIVGEFSYSMRTELNITRNFKEEEEAYQNRTGKDRDPLSSRTLSCILK
jgi:hypothetical protein